MFRERRMLSQIICAMLIIAEHAAKAAECAFDEECMSIKECGLEYKFFLARDYKELRKLNICGIEARTDKHCCKVDQIDDVHVRISKVTSNRIETITNHPNIHLINHKKCGKTTKDRIVGGSRASVGQFPWNALLQYQPKSGDSELEFLCGGSLIARRHILTAAHCIDNRGFTLVSVRLGEHTISKELDCDFDDDPNTCNNDNPPYQDIAVKKSIVHEAYSQRKKINDIALILLEADVKLKGVRYIETICLPIVPNQMIENIKENEKQPLMLISGWGRTEYSSKISDVLLQAKVGYIEQDDCIEKFNDIKSRFDTITIDIQETHLCAGGANKTDTCQGDSGGPIMYPAEHSEGKYRMYQHGIVSGGIGCSLREPFPGLYTRISSYMNWILDNLSVD